MLNERESTKILNEGEVKFSHDEMLQIREFLTKLALIEFERNKQQNDFLKNECNLLPEGQYRRTS
jgi:adenylate cyclase class IV